MNNVFGNKNLRSLHRDFGYFFVGLIIAFCVSGIMINHKSTWNPVRYKFNSSSVQSGFHLPKGSITAETVKSFNTQNNVDGFMGYDFKGDSTLVILYKMANATINLSNGKGTINTWKERPVSTQLFLLHRSFNGNNWYTFYSDFFALGLIFIASTGMFLMRGKNSFRKRGWLFAIAGIVVPIIALILLS